MAGPGIELRTLATLVWSCTTELPRSISVDTPYDHNDIAPSTTVSLFEQEVRMYRLHYCIVHYGTQSIKWPYPPHLGLFQHIKTYINFFFKFVVFIFIYNIYFFNSLNNLNNTTTKSFKSFKIHHIEQVFIQTGMPQDTKVTWFEIFIKH